MTITTYFSWPLDYEVLGATYRQNKNGEWDYYPGTIIQGEFLNGEIDNVVIALNGILFGANSQSCEYVCLHETGHAVGLQHTYDPNAGDTPVNIPALMAPKADSPYARDYLTSWDKEGFL